MGFRNTSYNPPPSNCHRPSCSISQTSGVRSNWTDVKNVSDSEKNDSIDGSDSVIDLNGNTKKKVMISEEQKLQFMPDNDDNHYVMRYDDDDDDNS